MLLIGVNCSPYTRRVAITLTAYGVAYEQKCVSGFGNREEVRSANPLGRIPALVLDNGETLLDSGAIVDHLDEVYGGDRPLTPRSGADRRAVLKVAAIMMGACDKALQAAYHRNHTPVEKRHQPWVDDCHGAGRERAGGDGLQRRSGGAVPAAGSSHPGRHHRLCRRAARAFRTQHRHRLPVSATAGAHAQARRRNSLSLTEP